VPPDKLYIKKEIEIWRDSETRAWGDTFRREEMQLN
jgi:hypothetical protein